MARTAEGRGATVADAVREALAELGLQEADVTVEVLAEPRRGLFSGGRRAHVRVTARVDVDVDEGPAGDVVADEATSDGEQQLKEERVSDTDADTQDGVAPESDRGPGDAPAAQAPAAGPVADGEISPEERMNQLDEEADLAADFVEGLLDRFDLPGDLEIEVHEDQAFVNLQDVDSGILIGRRGATLDALQELVRCAVQRQTERRAHVRVDVEGYKARQTEKLRDKCREAIAQVRETGEPVRLEPMDPYERKLMHNLVAKTGGVTSVSEGHEPKRRVVIHPAE